MGSCPSFTLIVGTTSLLFTKIPCSDGHQLAQEPHASARDADCPHEIARQDSKIVPENVATTLHHRSNSGLSRPKLCLWAISTLTCSHLPSPGPRELLSKTRPHPPLPPPSLHSHNPAMRPKKSVLGYYSVTCVVVATRSIPATNLTPLGEPSMACPYLLDRPSQTTVA